MFKSLRYLVSPKMIQQVNYSIYHYVKLSLLVSLYSTPWILTNIIFRFSVATYAIFAMSFVFVLPTYITSYIFLNSDVTSKLDFKLFSRELFQNYLRKLRVGLSGVLIVSLMLLDYHVVINMMKKENVFLFFFILIMFVVIAVLYSLHLVDQNKYNWKQILTKSLFFSWGYPIRTLFLFSLSMCWIGVGYHIPLINIIFGNGIFFGIIHRVVQKKVDIVND